MSEARWRRGWVELAHARELVREAVAASGWPAGTELKVLSRDAGSGALTGLLRLPPGYRRPAGHHPAEVEFLVLSGAVRIGSVVRGFGYYEHAAPGARQERWVTEEGAELLLMARTGAPDLVPEPPPEVDGRLELDTELLPWRYTPIAGPPPGMCVKPLRTVEATGERAALVACVPDYSYPKLEFHDCIEEIYCVSGDIRLANAGLMTAGSYLWRPPYITHGPFRSERGCVLFLWVDETLVNHFVGDPDSSREANRQQAERERLQQGGH